MSDSNNPFLNNPGGKRPDDGFGLPPMSGNLPGGVPTGGGLPPSERVAAGMPTGAQGSGRAEDQEFRVVRPVDEEKAALVDAVVGAPAPGAAKVEEKPVKAAAKQPEKKTDDNMAGIIDTFEAIVIALILALTFRAFVVEAFVIPTGSMAPTLLGAHFNVICPKCGYAFAENTSLDTQLDGNNHMATFKPGTGMHPDLTDSTAIPAPNYRHCPNCGFEIHAKELPDRGRDAFTPVGWGARVYFPWTNNGDRILVLKYLYAVMEPKRYDVIVFKEPMVARDNYIKRLIGLPGDTIEVIGGKVYIGTGQDGKNHPENRFIQRKPKNLQDALWQLVYDNDYYPIDAYAKDTGEKPRLRWSPQDPEKSMEPREGWTSPWSGDNWDATHSEVKYTGAGAGTLEFGKHLTPTQWFYTQNVLGYNTYPGGLPPSDEIDKANERKRMPVGDLHLETVWTPAVDGEEVSMTLGKPNNCWRVTLLKDGSPKLERWNGATETGTENTDLTTNEKSDAPKAGVARHLVMNNVDRAIEFYVDGKLVLEHVDKDWNAAKARLAVGYTDVNQNWRPEQGSDEAHRAIVSITASGSCTLAHLKLMRDLYYTDTNEPGQQQFRTAYTGNPVTLGADEFFAMGDNSTNSSDGRMWDKVYAPLDDLGTPYGIVPRRYLLGKAFFVYWPAGSRLPESWRFIPFLGRLPGVPNTGEMRLIR